ncbi:hypothetical protein [Flavihumibacter profundi]|uniref:hypothetical protein n=1 Tax=Flavihumibacter profundi TaxID=2716883 RepID=UPI001CC7FF9C|nr:hypothetical protein [Flavihumibacter profundi]MBZ5858704.1 hypothetical protein [Flavihumibacter profundi]
MVANAVANLHRQVNNRMSTMCHPCAIHVLSCVKWPFFTWLAHGWHMVRTSFNGCEYMLYAPSKTGTSRISLYPVPEMSIASTKG